MGPTCKKKYIIPLTFSQKNNDDIFISLGAETSNLVKEGLHSSPCSSIEYPENHSLANVADAISLWRHTLRQWCRKFWNMYYCNIWDALLNYFLRRCRIIFFMFKACSKLLRINHCHRKDNYHVLREPCHQNYVIMCQGYHRTWQAI